MGTRTCLATFVCSALLTYWILEFARSLNAHLDADVALQTKRLRLRPAAVLRDPIRQRGAGRAVSSSIEARSLPPHVSAPSNFVAVITAARIANVTLQQSRDVEYRLGLPFFFDHFSTVMCVASGPDVAAWPLLNDLPFSRKVYFTSGLKSKSAKESEALRAFVTQVDPEIERIVGHNRSDIIVFKASGRYQVVRDDVLRIVQEHPQNDVWYLPFGNWYVRDGVLLFDPGNALAMTFFIALRYTVFRDFYMSVDLEKLNTFGGSGYDVERAIVDFVKERGLRAHLLSHLHVVANIGDEGTLKYF